MRFLFDQSADFRLIPHLRSLGHDVSAVSRDYPHGLADEDVLAIARDEHPIPILIFLIPASFLLLEFSFRSFYWIGYVRRIDEIRGYLTGKTNDFPLYNMKKPSSKTGWDRLFECCAFQQFDFLFYSIWAVIALGAGLILTTCQG